MTEPTSDACQAVLSFWFEEIEPRMWWQKDVDLDASIRERFGMLHEQAVQGELLYWRRSPEGRLAEIIVLDQFSRNIWRDRPQAFAQDGMALVLAQEAIGAGADQQLPPQRRVFFYMPYMHSESLAVHQLAMKLFDVPGLEENLRFEKRHRDIILRFGRYPHRNAVLGRASSPEEQAFLEQPGSSF
ncbi:Uncharacterized conserved protein, DUF924 family [Halopseudomonas xinjiangensis]|uniref:Uncharacterized conserved protein, DUF924 family n=1 Tax=Halopseudomonas xinjiangensis TaxID=487184 RepID=A0A1H1X1C3_9GAMM|nr:DUF924 family protein [Halopseudomonas xinjiangensis]SDT02850.1 Uncharacterized conserved protein, DUF924 family [Halopseudomonas xinjiangensis]